MNFACNHTSPVMSAGRLTRPVFVALVLVTMALAMSPKPAQAIDTSAIVSSSASTDCLDYKVIGVCVWLTCTPFGCDIETSVQVRHYLPELVVSTYQRTGDNPWGLVASWAPPTSESRHGGFGTQDRAAQIHTNLRFKNADAIGHPGGAVFGMLSSMGYSCESSATAMMPYYLSVYDATAWRAGVPEKSYPEALIPGMRTIGDFGNVWGHVYPRSGFVVQANDYKAAAVTAQRVADFVTRNWQPHVYLPLTENWRPGYWPPGPVIEGDPDRGKWQRLQPNMTKQCSVFPDHSASQSFAGDIAEDGDYVWVLWRAYSCCEREGAILIVFTPPNNGSMK